MLIDMFLIGKAGKFLFYLLRNPKSTQGERAATRKLDITQDHGTK
jgi:hypothetical protein